MENKALETALVAMRSLGDYHRESRDRLIYLGSQSRRRVLEGQDVGLVNIAYERAAKRQGTGSRINIWA